MKAPFWHAARTKFHKLPTCPTIDLVGIIFNVVVVYNGNKVVQLRGGHWNGDINPNFVIFKCATFDVGQSGNGRF